MALVLHRTTKEVREFANTPDYDPAVWIINPDLSVVIGWPNRYWVIAGDMVSLMAPAERDAVDATRIAAARDAVAAEMDDAESYARAFALLVLDELNGHAATINALLSAIDNASNLGTLKTAVASIQDYPLRTVDQLKTALRVKLGN